VTHLIPAESTKFLSDQSAPIAVQLSQRLGRGITIQYFSKKSKDGVDVGKRNEDAIAWQLDPDGILSFAVCEGVGSSYLGYIAARLLAEELIDALLASARFSEDFTEDDLESLLDEWKYQAQEQMAGIPLSQDTSPVQAQIIRERRQLGSQTVFFCGYLDWRPGGPQRSVFAWMGNVKGQAFSQDGRTWLDLREMADDGPRWSTIQGCMGKPQVRWIATNRIHRLLIWSDGFDETIENMVTARTQEIEARSLDVLRARAFDDDASFLSIWRSDPVHPSQTQSRIPRISFPTWIPLTNSQSRRAGAGVPSSPQRLTAPQSRLIRNGIAAVLGSLLLITVLILLAHGLQVPPASDLPGSVGSPTALTSLRPGTNTQSTASPQLQASSVPAQPLKTATVSGGPQIASTPTHVPLLTEPPTTPSATLSIPVQTIPEELPTSAPEPSPSVLQRTHQVGASETLIAIAKSYQVSLAAIMVANDIHNPRDIGSGQTLVIPPQDFHPRNLQHRVAAGETVSGIAALYDVTLNTIIGRNGLVYPYEIYPGQILVIPLK
jgi:LysM repeat protein